MNDGIHVIEIAPNRLDCYLSLTGPVAGGLEPRRLLCQALRVTGQDAWHIRSGRHAGRSYTVEGGRETAEAQLLEFAETILREDAQ